MIPIYMSHEYLIGIKEDSYISLFTRKILIEDSYIVIPLRSLLCLGYQYYLTKDEEILTAPLMLRSCSTL